jgi:hypothetical protein
MVRPERRERLGDRRVHSAVDESGRLHDVLAHENTPADELVGRLQNLESVVAVERRNLEETCSIHPVHRPPHLSIGCQITAGKCKAPWTRSWNTL